MKSPIYTEKTICRDCYKCVRQCPVKAIKVTDGSAVVMHDLCIFCGKCIEVCPVNAKKLRSDSSRLKQLIELNDTVIASIAPSFPAEFDCSAAELVQTLKQLGFSGVSETAIGAEIISRRIAEKRDHNRVISSACPTINELIRKYRPELVKNISDIVSPLHAHAAYLKELYGSNIKVVFIGPCISKKLEADDINTPIDLALTFKELRELLEQEEICITEVVENESSNENSFIPEETITAAEFAVEGGMLNTIKINTSTIDPQLMSCSGIENIIRTFNDIPYMLEKASDEMFLEYLACDGGCISGKGMTSNGGYLVRRLAVLDYYKHQNNRQRSEPLCSAEITQPVIPEPVTPILHSEKQLTDVLLSLDKTRKEDELNCGGCGYNTCRDFAAALLDGKAENTMCVTNMRKLAEKKSNALMKALPLGVVIADRNKRILECNSKFLQLFSEIDPELNENASKHIEGLELNRFIQDCSLFDKIKISSKSMLEDKIRFKDRIFRVFIFRISSEDMIGAVFQDITSPAVRRETIIRKTEEVIEKSLSSVQQIASLLGENAAETQLILNSLIESYNDGDEK